jgi:hypothetical protein
LIWRDGSVVVVAVLVDVVEVSGGGDGRRGVLVRGQAAAAATVWKRVVACVLLERWHCRALLVEHLLERLAHDDHVLAGLVVRVAVVEHELDVGDALVGCLVVVRLEPLLDRAEVHRLRDHFVVILFLWKIMFLYWIF